MITVLSPYEARNASALVLAALQRSVSVSQVRQSALSELSNTSLLVVVDLPEVWCDSLIDWFGANRSCKLLVLGPVPDKFMRRFGWEAQTLGPELKNASLSQPAVKGQCSESAAIVRYSSNAKLLGAGLWTRPFERFDFTDEWNNLGYGAIRYDDSCWTLACGVDAKDHEIAAACIGEERVTSYAALVDEPSHSVLWVNRSVGSIDSFEWRIVENFFSAYRSDTLPCQPILREIPWGYDAAITSRLDCDEDVESARALWSVYRELGVPFSLAVNSANLSDPNNFAILEELASHDQAVLSHTATHAPNWGGSYDAAYREGFDSAEAIRKVIRKPVKYAVSPFHQTPHYALQGLCDAGFAGCIGGIIRNDPDFTLARGGVLSGLPRGFVGHSQQCMLHGDCMLSHADPLSIYKRAFDQSFDTCSIFGYLDHPFSARYAYGWNDEMQRGEAHRALIQYIRSQCKNALFFHENDAMDFLMHKSKSNVYQSENCYSVDVSTDRTQFTLAVEYKGRIHPARDFREMI